MDLFRRIFFAAVLAGAVAGLAMATLQQWRVVPLILEAEQYEGEGHSHAAPVAQVSTDNAHAHDTATPDNHSHDVETPAEILEPWAPADGIERTVFTTVATVLAGVGFAFLMGAVSILVAIEITPSNGLMWGLGGFLTFTLAPAFGLAPELPGMVGADLVARQFWWWGTAIATGVAIVGYAKIRTPVALLLGLVLIAVPHVIGAPQAPESHTELPAHIATTFASATLAVSLVYWLACGALLGWSTKFLAERNPS